VPIQVASLVESDGLKQSGSTSVNWNGTGSDTETVQVNINPSYVNYDSGSAVVDIIDDDKFNDHNDWGNLYVYYNDHHAGVSRTLEDPNREIIREYDAPRNMIPFQRSK
jgi:hypothetical protein